MTGASLQLDETSAPPRGGLAGLLARTRTLFAASAPPDDTVAALRACGALIAPMPRRLGGLGLGVEPGQSVPLFHLLRLLGAGTMAAGRLLEGHVNAIRLIALYGTPGQLRRAAADTLDGHLFAIWNTEASPGLRYADGMLSGRKVNCSAAAVATRAVITVDETRMLIVRLRPGERSGAMPGRLHGMRDTGPGWIDFARYAPEVEDWLGSDGDYLREPEFSGGAWRTLAVLAGGIAALSAELRGQLHSRGREAAPWQAARIAEGLIAEETANAWALACARQQDDATPADDARAYVSLARRAVEAAGLTLIDLVQRSLGLAAMVEGNAAEGLMRDLATYLRQPALDEALAEAAAWFVARDLPRAAP